MIKTDALICLAAGKSQLLIIRKAVSLGFKIIAVDIDPNAIGFKYSTKKIISSTYDSNNIIIELNKISKQYNFIGILNRSSGIPVITASKISKEFELESYSIKTSEIVINKHLLFTFIKKSGINLPNFKIIKKHQINDIGLKFPFIIKPSLSLVGKSGIMKISNHNDYQNNIESSFENSLNDFIVVQDFIEGDDITMISFVQNKNLFPLAFIEEINHINSNNKIFGLGVMAPARIKERIKNEIIDISNKLINDLSIINSPFMISFRLSNNTLNIIEIHLDFGGDLILEELLPKHINIDVAAFGIQLMAGKIIKLPDIKNRAPVAILYHPGDNLNSERNFEVLEDKTIEKLMLLFNNKKTQLYE